jgi:vitamin B12 transporter
LGRWNNITNKDYQLAHYYATAGSNVFVGVNYGFK